LLGGLVYGFQRARNNFGTTGHGIDNDVTTGQSSGERRPVKGVSYPAIQVKARQSRQAGDSTRHGANLGPIAQMKHLYEAAADKAIGA
jgi:hypothetical protein